MKDLKISFYQWLYTWALRQWRVVVSNPDLRAKGGKLSAHAIIRYFERVEV